MSSTTPPALVAEHISKWFGGVRALDDVSLTVLPGEVHVLLGENGSGKSTLIKVLAGSYAPEPGGKLRVYGREVRLPLRAGEARELGLTFVHQDLGLIPSLSVVENLRLGELAQRRGWHISWRDERRRARSTFRRFELPLDPRGRVADLSPLERALLAIVRAVAELERGSETAKPGVLVLDEPTVFLPQRETERFFALLREVAAGGAGVLFVSHDLAEVQQIGDRVTVLRDGRNVGTVSTDHTDEDGLIELVVGRRIARVGSRRARPSQIGTVSFIGVSGDVVRDVSIELQAGEVVGLTGLAGSGSEEVVYLAFGARARASGSLVLAGSRYDLAGMTPERALAAGIALLPADRQRDGSVASLSVADNVTLPVLDRFTTRLGLLRRRLLRGTADLLASFDVRPRNPVLLFGALSGGNQQRALLAKWLQTTPRLLLLHEPTQGVDIGARGQIFSLIRAAAAGGAAILCASTDHEPLAALCDRVLVFSSGKVVRELSGHEVAREQIAEATFATPRP